MPRRRLVNNLLTLTAREDGTVDVHIDLPPSVATKSSDARPWTVDEVRRYAEWEVRRTQHNLPPNVESVEFVGAPTMCLDDAGDCVVAPAHGPPWVVHARVNRPASSAYHTPGGLLVRLVLDDRYPRSPPNVHVLQIISHFFFDDENGLPPIFYEVLSDLAIADGDASGLDEPLHSIRATLALVDFVLQTPLHPCEACQSKFDAHADMQRARRSAIDRYVPQRTHASLFDGAFRPEWLDPEMRAAMASGTDAAILGVVERLAEGIYSFPLFTREVCEMLLDEADGYNASGLPTSRPNSMNKYGLVLNEIGLEGLFDSLLRRYLQRIARLLFPCEGGALDRHHTFIVSYAEGKDLGLDMHTDNSDVTFNVCLGREFSAAGLAFCGQMGQPAHRHFSYRYAHALGRCVVHLGQQRHGADDIVSGERHNAIIWCHNLAYRASRAYADLQTQRRYARESAPPDKVCLSYTHDRDYLKYKERPAQHAKMIRRGWCPPLFARHDADGPDGAAENATTLQDVRELQALLRTGGGPEEVDLFD